MIFNYSLSYPVIITFGVMTVQMYTWEYLSYEAVFKSGHNTANLCSFIHTFSLWSLCFEKLPNYQLYGLCLTLAVLLDQCLAKPRQTANLSCFLTTLYCFNGSENNLNPSADPIK